MLLELEDVELGEVKGGEFGELESGELGGFGCCALVDEASPLVGTSRCNPPIVSCHVQLACS